MKSIFSTIMITLFFSSISFAVNPTDGLPAAVLKKHLAISDNECETDLPSAAESYDLGKGHTLYLVPCYLGAYQGSSFGYVAQGESVTPVMVLAYDETVKAVVADLNLSEVAFDPQTKMLTTFAKGRGIGDCGQSSKSKIELSQYGSLVVKTVEIRNKSKCDGRMTTWPVVFKQK